MCLKIDMKTMKFFGVVLLCCSFLFVNSVAFVQDRKVLSYVAPKDRIMANDRHPVLYVRRMKMEERLNGAFSLMLILSSSSWAFGMPFAPFFGGALGYIIYGEYLELLHRRHLLAFKKNHTKIGHEIQPLRYVAYS